MDIIIVRRGHRSTGEAYILLRMPIQVELVLRKDKTYIGKRYVEVNLAKKLVRASAYPTGLHMISTVMWSVKLCSDDHVCYCSSCHVMFGCPLCCMLAESLCIFVAKYFAASSRFASAYLATHTSCVFAIALSWCPICEFCAPGL